MTTRRTGIEALTILLLIGAGCAATSTKTSLTNEIRAPQITDVAQTKEKSQASVAVIPRVTDWRDLLDMSKAKARVLESGRTSISLPPLFFEPNDEIRDVPDISYSLREEPLDVFPSSDDTPWHTSGDIAQEKDFIAGGKVVPRIHSGAEKLTRYSKDGAQGYLAYDCLTVEGKPSLSIIFTFFDETHRYRIELLEMKGAWRDLDQDEFHAMCVDRVDRIDQRSLDAESADKYQILNKIIGTIGKN